MDDLNDGTPAGDWLKAELEDTLDEDYEIELEDAVLSMEIRKIYQAAHPDTLPRPEEITVRLWALPQVHWDTKPRYLYRNWQVRPRFR